MSVHEATRGEPSPQGVVAAVSCNDAYSFSKPNRPAIELVAGLGVRGDVHAGVTVRHRSRVAADPTQPNLRQVHLIPAELHDQVRGVGHEVPAGGLGENVTTSGLDLFGLPCGTVLRFGPPPPVPGNGSRNGEPVSTRGARGDEQTHGNGPGDVVAAAEQTSLDAATAGAVAVLSAVIEAEAARGGSADPRAAVVITGLRNPCQQINRFSPGLLKEVLGKDSDGNLVRRAGVMAVVLRGGTVRPGDPIAVEVPAVVPHRALDRV
ncbi:MOSC domain-containing protein [Actinoplanes sp. NPDC049681]|uniref:MOSC domain-containing protein n=1 Tax=Actinoplanes sp. NPDC049681 TaxID=3363905 RepID=UPI0037BD6876